MGACVLSDHRGNNFNLIRMIAASAVIVSHAFPLALGPGTPEPLHEWLYPLDLGKAAVQVFFAISGYLVTRSFDARPLPHYAFQAVHRIVPALAVVVSLMVILAPFDPFAANPYPGTLNGSLWTLWYEVGFYSASSPRGGSRCS